MKYKGLVLVKSRNCVQDERQEGSIVASVEIPPLTPQATHAHVSEKKQMINS